MKTFLSRALRFIALVTILLAVVWLLQDEMGPSRRPVAAVTREAGATSEPSVGFVDQAARTETRVNLIDLDFDVERMVEVEPGREEMRAVYRIHVREGRPGQDGTYTVSDPVITFLEPLTGAARGTLQADRGRFRTNQAGDGMLSFDPGQVDAESVHLEGRVRGRFPLADGEEAQLEARELDVAGEVVTAPGRVLWHRGPLHLSGLDLTWDGALGRLDYDRDARITLDPSEGVPQTTLRAPGGLTWNVPPDGPGRGRGVLHGPVTGERADGASLAAGRVELDADARSMILLEEPHVDMPRSQGISRLSGDTITVSQGLEGDLDFLDAVGNARLETHVDGVRVELLEGQTLSARGERLVVPGQVRLVRGDLQLTGNDLAWDGMVLTLASHAVVVGDDTLAGAFAGGRLVSPGGLRFRVPRGQDAPLGDGALHGPVTGTLTDGSTLEAARMELVGPLRSAVFLGDVVMEQPHPTGLRRLTGQRVEFRGDPDGASGTTLCEGGVTLRAVAPDGQPLLLVTEQLELLADRIVAPTQVEITSGTRLLSGVGLVIDDIQGRLVLERDVVLGSVASDQGLLTLSAEGGLVWTYPGRDSAQEGHGELAGPVHGTLGQGQQLFADRVLLDGDDQAATLLGHALVDWPGEGWLRSESLHLRQRPEGVQVSSRDEVEWTWGELAGRGRGLLLDEGAGQLVLDQDVLVTDASSGGLTLRSAGSLRWTAPPGSVDVLAEGHGELRDQVVVSDAEGLELTSDLVVVDGPRGTIELAGPCRGALPGEGGTLVLDAAEGMDLIQGPDGLMALWARGEVRGSRGSDLRFRTDLLEADRLERLVRFLGRSEIEQISEEGRTTTLTTAPEGSITAHTDAQDEVQHVAAEGGVTIRSGELVAECARVDWNLPSDHVLMEGACRFLSMGAWMEAPRVELWPRARRWFIPTSTVVLDDAR